MQHDPTYTGKGLAIAGLVCGLLEAIGVLILVGGNSDFS